MVQLSINDEFGVVEALLAEASSCPSSPNLPSSSLLPAIYPDRSLGLLLLLLDCVLVDCDYVAALLGPVIPYRAVYLFLSSLSFLV